MLHITNGDSAGATIGSCGIGGVVLPWRDVLHEGPVPAGLTLYELREVRARFLADRRWADYATVRAELTQRDDTLASFADHEEVVLWFEHDLYDQLQLIQILDWFAGRDMGATRLSLICIDAFPGVTPFLGLGQLSSPQMASLFPGRQSVSGAQLEMARAAWVAFRSPNPTAIERVIAGDTGSLPFLSGALGRFVEEFPDLRGGLSRTEWQALDELRRGPRTAAELFLAVGRREERPFMGDDIFWDRLRSLVEVPHPLVKAVGDVVPDPSSFGRQTLEITTDGLDVVSGNEDHAALNGLNRWLGGVHLTGAKLLWRRDISASPTRLVRAA